MKRAAPCSVPTRTTTHDALRVGEAGPLSQRALHLALRARAIFLMHPRQEPFEGDLARLRLESVDPKQLVGPRDGVRRERPFPAAEVGDLLRGCELVLDASHVTALARRRAFDRVHGSPLRSAFTARHDITRRCGLRHASTPPAARSATSRRLPFAWSPDRRVHEPRACRQVLRARPGAVRPIVGSALGHDLGGPLAWSLDGGLIATVGVAEDAIGDEPGQRVGRRARVSSTLGVHAFRVGVGAEASTESAETWSGTIGIDGHVLDPLRETTAGGSETGHATEPKGGSHRIATGEGIHEEAIDTMAGGREKKLTRGDGIGRAAAPGRRETGDQGAKVSLNHAPSRWPSMKDANV